MAPGQRFTEGNTLASVSPEGRLTWNETIRKKTFQNWGAQLNTKSKLHHKPDVPRISFPFFLPEGKVEAHKKKK
jgi:hypothetical protein